MSAITKPPPTAFCPHCGTTNRATARFCNTCGTPLIPISEWATGTLPTNFKLRNRYIILHRLGQGGMGAVYSAGDQNIVGKIWAIKEMSDAGILSPRERTEAVTAFQQEAQLLARLDHPNIPKVIDFFSENHKHYIVMDFVPGETLAEIIDRQNKPFDEQQVRDWALELCAVLSYLHNQSPPIIFRDLKPGNIMLTPDGRLKLIDFGIARFFKPGKGQDTQLLGTPGYAAPEQYGQGQTDARADIYALGATLHHLLTGYDPVLSPFRFPQIRDRNHSVSQVMEIIIMRALEADPSMRWLNAHEMGQALAQLNALPAAYHPPGSPVSQKPSLISKILSLFGKNLNSWEKSSPKPFDSSTSPQFPSQPKWSSTRPSIILKPEYTGWMNHAKKDHIQSLFLQENYQRLQNFLTLSQGGKFVLTGYDRFGGTTLVNSVRGKMGGNVSLLTLHFNIIYSSTQNVTEFGLKLNDSRFGTLTTRCLNISEISISQSAHSGKLSFNKKKPAGLFSYLAEIFPEQTQADFVEFVTEINAFLAEGKSTTLLQKNIPYLIKSDPSLSRVIIILDRVESLETLESLAKLGLFDNEYITFIAVARKEKVDRWHNCKLRIEGLGFTEEYIPCLWHCGDNYIQQILDILGQSVGSQPVMEGDENLILLRKHLSFKGRGALGRVLDTLREPKYFLSHEDGVPCLQLDKLPDRSEIVFQAWMQDILNLNWSSILLGFFGGSPQAVDRARIGVYHVLDWLQRSEMFTEKQVVDASAILEITISDNPDVRAIVIKNLLQVLIQNGYLKLMGDQYWRNWNDNVAPPKPCLVIVTPSQPSPPPPPPSPPLTPEQQMVWGELNETFGLIAFMLKQHWCVPSETIEAREPGVSNSLRSALENGTRNLEDTILQMVRDNLKGARNRIITLNRIVNKLTDEVVIASGPVAAQIKIKIEDSERERDKTIEEIKTIFQGISHTDIVAMMVEQQFT